MGPTSAIGKSVGRRKCSQGYLPTCNQSRNHKLVDSAKSNPMDTNQKAKVAE